MLTKRNLEEMMYAGRGRILMQLYLVWNPYVKELKQTIKNTSSELLGSFRRLTVALKMYSTFVDTQQCIMNSKAILTQAVVEWKRK